MKKGPEHKAAVMARVVAYVLHHGLSDLSLRPLAKVVGMSPRVLLYHFGSKELLVDGVLNEVRERNLEFFRAGQPSFEESPNEAFMRLWNLLSRTENRPYLRLFFQVYGLALTTPNRYPAFSERVVADWLEAFGGPSRTVSTVALAAIRGLLLDLLSTGDVKRTNAGARAFAGFLDTTTDKPKGAKKRVRT